MAIKQAVKQEKERVQRMEVDDAASSRGTASDAEDVATDDGGATSATEASSRDAAAAAPADAKSGDSKRCPFCSAKKMSSGCVVKACKKCCVSRNEDCAAHAKKDLMTKLLMEQSASNERPKKPVLKREFKETNIMYYEETVAIFCVKDFFASKKMSQGILNDQVRSLRVRGTYDGQQTAKRACVRDPELKARVAAVFAKDRAPFSPRHIAAVE